jgi:hypothetical protein
MNQVAERIQRFALRDAARRIGDDQGRRFDAGSITGSTPIANGGQSMA